MHSNKRGVVPSYMTSGGHSTQEIPPKPSVRQKASSWGGDFAGANDGTCLRNLFAPASIVPALTITLFLGSIHARHSKPPYFLVSLEIRPIPPSGRTAQCQN
jgi:hypothetical protein